MSNARSSFCYVGDKQPSLLELTSGGWETEQSLGYASDSSYTPAYKAKPLSVCTCVCVCICVHARGIASN